MKKKGFLAAELIFAKPDNSVTRVALLQPLNGIVATPARIGNADQALAHKQHLAFIKLVAQMQPFPSFIATPEYSTPWSVVDELLLGEIYPPEGSIWMLGCESTTLDALKTFIAKHQKIYWWSEANELAAGPKTFVDPLLFIFRGKETKGKKRTIAIAVQFKRAPMGGADGQIERDHLVVGTKQYFLRSTQDNSIAIVGLLCSDVLDFEHKLLKDYSYWSYMLVHLQCTPDVYKPMLTKYRQNIYKTNEGKSYACLTLNWASGTTSDGKKQEWAFGGSALYFRTDKRKLDSQPRQADAILDSNHKQGVYLRFCKATQSVAYYLGGSPMFIDFYTTKHDQRLSAAAEDVAGVSKPTTRVWSEKSSEWQVTTDVDDRVTSMIAEKAVASLIALKGTPSARERLIAFSTGNFHRAEKWHQPSAFESYEVTPDEELPRGTIVWLRQKQLEYIDQILERFRTIETDVIVNKLTAPVEFTDLKGKTAALGLHPDASGTYKSNILANGKPAHAAVIFLGDASQNRAQAFFDELLAEVKPNRAAVWYREANQMKFISTTAPKYTEPQADPRSITNPEKRA